MSAGHNSQAQSIYVHCCCSVCGSSDGSDHVTSLQQLMTLEEFVEHGTQKRLPDRASNPKLIDQFCFKNVLVENPRDPTHQVPDVLYATTKLSVCCTI